MTDTAACLRCREQIDVKATRCHECGYDPGAEWNSGRTLYRVIIGIMCFFLIGIPFALHEGIKQDRAKRWKPTEVEPRW